MRFYSVATCLMKKLRVFIYKYSPHLTSLFFECKYDVCILYVEVIFFAHCSVFCDITF